GWGVAVGVTWVGGGCRVGGCRWLVAGSAAEAPSPRLTREGLRVPSCPERQGFVGSGRAAGQGTASGPPAPSRGPEASVGEPPCPRGLASLCRPVGVVHRGGRGAFVPLRSLLHAEAVSAPAFVALWSVRCARARAGGLVEARDAAWCEPGAHLPASRLPACRGGVD